MNPELKRNLLIEITLQRLIAMPVILGLIFAATWAVKGSHGVIGASTVLFWALIYLWGTRKAAGSFDAELANNTWDGQRLSALTAFQIFVGKLFGSTAFVLYGAVICVGVTAAARLDVYLWTLAVQSPLPAQSSVPARLSGLDPGDIVWAAVNDVLSGLLGLVFAMFAAVVLMARIPRSKGISVTLCQISAIVVAGLVADRFGDFGVTMFVRGFIEETPAYSVVNWYGAVVPVMWFVTGSLVVYLLWAMLGTIRQLRGVLQFRGYRWAWLLFVVFVAFYVAGFDVLYRYAESFADRAFMFLTVAWATAATFTYLAVFAEPKPLQGYRSYIAAARRFRVADMLEHQPFWLTTLLLVFVALVLNLIIGQAQVGLRGRFDPDVATLFGIGSALVDPKILLITASLFLVRDCLLVMTLNFGRRRRRADLAALVYLAVLYVVVPLLLDGFGLEQTLVANFFVPRVADGLFAAAWPVLLEVAALAILTVYRWRAVREPLAPDSA